jgi:hypothetical protein
MKNNLDDFFSDLQINSQPFIINSNIEGDILQTREKKSSFK